MISSLLELLQVIRDLGELGASGIVLKYVRLLWAPDLSVAIV